MTPPNVLYVTVDSLRADHTGHLGYDRPTTPTIDALADRGTVCPRTVASGIPTFYAFNSLLGGVPALGHSRDIGMPALATTLGERFRDRGYTTAGFNAGNPWLTREYGYDRGFETFRDYLTDETERDSTGFGRRITKAARRLQPYVEASDFLADRIGLATRVAFALADHTPIESAETVTEAAVEWLRNRGRDRPFFLWVHYMDPHYPWTPRSVDLDQFANGPVSKIDVGRLWHAVSSHGTHERHGLPTDQVEDIVDLYDAELRRTDDAVSRLLDALRETSQRGNTLVTLVGDHGTELGDHGGFSHGPRTLYNEVLHVPLVFAGPSVPDKRLNSVTSLVDVPPSLADVAGIGGADGMAGISMFTDRRETAVSEVVYDYEPRTGDNHDNGLLRACVEWPWKLIINGELDTRELYHLERDPDELTDVSATNPRVVSRLTGTLDETRRQIERRNDTAEEKSRVRSTLSELEKRGAI